jgi:hypothetical protein
MNYCLIVVLAGITWQLMSQSRAALALCISVAAKRHQDQIADQMRVNYLRTATHLYSCSNRAISSQTAASISLCLCMANPLVWLRIVGGDRPKRLPALGRQNRPVPRILGSIRAIAARMVFCSLHYGPCSVRQQAVQNGTQTEANGNGHTNGRRRDGTRRATARQVRALYAIADRQQLDAAGLVQSRYGVDKPEDLSITEASELIDSLKAAGKGNGGRR